MEFDILYQNDEGEHVVLNDEPMCLRISASSWKRIEGTDISRLHVKLQLFEGSSPSVKTKPVEKTDSCSSNSDPKARDCLKVTFFATIMDSKKLERPNKKGHIITEKRSLRTEKIDTWFSYYEKKIREAEVKLERSRRKLGWPYWMELSNDGTERRNTRNILKYDILKHGIYGIF